MKSLFKVLSQTEPVSINSQNGPLQKSTLVLQEIGGKYEDSYVCTLLGALASYKFQAGTFVWASIRFQARDYNGSSYQDVTIQDIINFSTNS